MARGYYPGMNKQPVQIVDLTQALAVRAALAAQAQAEANRTATEQARQWLHDSEQAELRAKFVQEVNQPGRVWMYSGPDRAELEFIAGKFRRQGLIDTSLPPMPIGSNTYLSVQQEKEQIRMDKKQAQNKAKSVMDAYGLDPENDRHVQAATDELLYGISHMQDGQGYDSAAEQAIQRAARRLGLRQPGGMIQADPRDFKQRYMESLDPKLRAQLENAQEYQKTEAYAQEYQSELRARYISEIQEHALDYGHGNRLDDRTASRIASKYQQQGLMDTRLTREDLLQTDDALLQDASKRIGRNPGAANYRPAFGYAGDHREQGHPMPGTAKGGR